MAGAARVGDKFTCGDHIKSGSSNVFINGMPAARKGDPTTGHDIYKDNKIIEGCSTVFINGIPAATINCKNELHQPIPGGQPHDGTVAIGSSDVHIE